MKNRLIVLFAIVVAVMRFAKPQSTNQGGDIDGRERGANFKVLLYRRVIRPQLGCIPLFRVHALVCR